MKKKLLIWLLTVLCTCTCAIGFTACDFIDGNGGIFGGGNNNDTDDNPSTYHTHEWSDTYTADGGRHYRTCSGCDEKKYGSHNYTDLVCDECGRNLPVVVGTEGLSYCLNRDEKSYYVLIVETVAATEIIIPSVYEGLPVTYIEGSPFGGGCTSLTSITIPDSVTSIGSYAFKDCTSLTSITIPDSVIEISTDAFYYCTSLTSVTIPDSVEFISGSAFVHCTSLANIIVSENHPYLKSVNGNLYSKDGIRLIRYAPGKGNHSFIIPDGVIQIDSYAFSHCIWLTSITLHDNVFSIGYYAFCNCRFKSIIIPKSCMSIADYAFIGCTSLTIYCEAEEKPNDWWQNWNKLKYNNDNTCPVVWGYKGEN